MRNEAMALLSEESRLSQIVKLVGPDALPDEQRLVLETARLLREGFLQQSALDDIDAYSTIQKQIQMLGLILHFHHRALRVVKKGATIAVIHKQTVVDTMIRMKMQVPNTDLSKLDEIRKQIDDQMSQLEAEYK
jgi:V/A-type H+-transporting ATPase subunit A